VALLVLGSRRGEALELGLDFGVQVDGEDDSDVITLPAAS
jgi:hypothetical protein